MLNLYLFLDVSGQWGLFLNSPLQHIYMRKARFQSGHNKTYRQGDSNMNEY